MKNAQERLSELASDNVKPLEVSIWEFTWPVYDFLMDAFSFAFIIVFGYILYVAL